MAEANGAETATAERTFAWELHTVTTSQQRKGGDKVIALKRSECAMLHIGLRSHWYRMIDSGTKCVEFREANEYWRVRFNNWVQRAADGKKAVIEFQNGYGRFSPRMTFFAGRRGEGVLFERLLATDPVQHRELGEFPKDRYALFIGERVKVVE